MRCKCHNLLKLYTYTHTQFSCDNLSVTSVIILILTACILFLVPYHPATAQTVHIPDPGLRAVIESALGKEAGAEITQSDMESLESLQANKCRFLTLSEEKGWWTPIVERWICESTDDTFELSIKDLTGLEYAINLKDLELGHNQITDVPSLKNLIKLTRLSLSNNRVSDITPLKNLTNLTHLSLSNNRVSDISTLSNLTELIELDLGGNRISDGSPLKNLTNLTYLHIGYNQVPDVTPLKDLAKLTFLELDENRIPDILPLKNLINLTELYLDDNEITDVSSLENLTKLKKLNLNDNNILDISILKNFTNLTFLDIHGNQISNILSLKNMKELSVLNFHENQIWDMSPLKDLKKLNILKCDDNKILNVAPLKNLTNLTMLDLSGNKILNVAPLKNLTKLTVLDLSHNHISDFSPITDLIDNLIEYDFSNQTELPFSFADVNRDGTVNIADLVAIASNFTDPDLEALAQMNTYPDVNGDGLVNLIDLLIVASEIGAAAAPALSKNQIEAYNLTAKDLTAWIRLAKQLNLAEPKLQQGIHVLEQLLAILSTQDELPEITALLPNYPNPFNPETWIPYQLARPAKVAISVHSADGKLVRVLELGQLSAGIYDTKSRAAHWDGRNEFGEAVSSGVYFYTLTTSDFTATGKMLIRK